MSNEPSENRRTLTSKDFDAADEAFRRFEEMGKPLEIVRGDLAWLHLELGAHFFRLHYYLREPLNQYELWHRQAYWHEISDQEFQDMAKRHAERPFDRVMLDQFFSEIESRLEAYNRALQIIFSISNGRKSGRSIARQERDALAVLSQANQESLLDELEFETALEFLQDTRFELNKGNVNIGQLQSSTAVELSLNTVNKALFAWKAFLDRSGSNVHSVMPPSQMFLKSISGVIPSPQSLLALVQEERAMARGMLSRQTKSEPPAQLAPPVEEENTIEGSVIPNLTSTSELLIGIDEDLSYWGLHMNGLKGSQFPKSKAIPLQLAGRRWKEVLRLLAGSKEGNEATIKELFEKLELLPSNPDSVKPRSDEDHESLENLDFLVESEHGSPARRPLVAAANSRLISTMGDLGKKIRNLLRIKSESNPTFRRNGNDSYVSSFRVQYLMRNTDRTYRFGDSTEST